MKRSCVIHFNEASERLTLFRLITDITIAPEFKYPQASEALGLVFLTWSYTYVCVGSLSFIQVAVQERHQVKVNQTLDCVCAASSAHLRGFFSPSLALAAAGVSFMSCDTSSMLQPHCSGNLILSSFSIKLIYACPRVALAEVKKKKKNKKKTFSKPRTNN